MFHMLPASELPGALREHVDIDLYNELHSEQKYQ